MVEFLDYARQRKAILYYDPNFRKAHAHEAIRLAPTLLENFEYADIVRGSDEDFLNIFGETDSEKVYTDHIRFYCDRFITTHGAGGVNLYHGDRHRHFDSPAIRPVSTIGAGDNFNAGILYGLLKYMSATATSSLSLRRHGRTSSGAGSIWLLRFATATTITFLKNLRPPTSLSLKYH